MKIIDSHVHIYPEKIAKKASQNVGNFYDLPMRYDGSVAQLISMCDENKISVCIVNSVATAVKQVRSINTFIAQSAADSNGRFTGLCTLHPDMTADEIAAELDFAAENKLVGIKLHPDFQQFHIDDTHVYAIYEQAAGRFPVLFHTGDKRYSFSSPERLRKVLCDFPQLTAVAAHFGGWSEWENGVQHLAGLPNLYVDTSSSLYALPPEVAKAYIRQFTPERVMFGTDYPMWGAKDELAAIARLGLSAYDLDCIFHRNAEQLYALPTEYSRQT